MKYSHQLLPIIIAVLSSPFLSFAENNVIYINGSSTVDSILLTPFKNEIEKMANVTIKDSVKKSEYGLRDLALGRCDIAMISGTLKSLAEILNDQLPNLIQLDQYQEFKLGESSVVFIVNKKNPIDFLPSDTLRRICIGDILNWELLGGKDSRVIFFTMERGDGVRTVIQDELLKGDFFGVYTTVLKNSSVMNDLVGYLTEAIGTNNIYNVNDSVKILKTDITLTQPLTLVTKSNARPEILAFINTLQKIANEKLPDLKKN